MRKLLLPSVAAVALFAVTGAATAATATVTITKNGFVPSATTIAQGDTVQFVNSDTVAHQVVFKPTTGVVCSPNPLVLQPGQIGSCTLSNAGSYAYSDPNAKGNTFRGTVTVNAATPGISLVASPSRIAYGATVTLTGALSSRRAGESVDVLALQCGSSAAAKVMTVQSGANGAFSAVVTPLMNTTYTAKVRNTTSTAASVSVRPKMMLTRVAAHRFSLRVNAATSFAGKYATFQRYNGTRWIAVKTVLLRSNTTGVSPTIVTSASFRSSVATGRRVRAVIGQAQVGSCYLPGISNSVVS